MSLDSYGLCKKCKTPAIVSDYTSLCNVCLGAEEIKRLQRAAERKEANDARAYFINHLDNLSVDEMIDMIPLRIYDKTYYIETRRDRYTQIPHTRAVTPYADFTRSYDKEFHANYSIQNVPSGMMAYNWSIPLVQSIDPRRGATKILIRLYDNGYIE